MTATRTTIETLKANMEKIAISGNDIDKGFQNDWGP